MSCYDTIRVPCPLCTRKVDAQTKSGECLLNVYELRTAPQNALAGVNDYAPLKCECGAVFEVRLDPTPILVDGGDLV